MELTKYKKFLIIILLCELRNNIANNCCYDCCCEICHDCINLKTVNKNGENLNENYDFGINDDNHEEDLNENYDFVINDDNHIDNKNFIAVNYENSKKKYSLKGLKTINSKCFNLKGNEYSKLKDIYINAFLFFVNIKEEDGSYKKTEDYIFEGEDKDGHYNFKENIGIERNQVPFWNWCDILIQDKTSSFYFICEQVINKIVREDSPIYNFKEIVFFLFGYLNEFIEKNKEKKTFTIEEYTSQVESMLKIFLYITQGLERCAAGQYEAIQTAFINVLDDFLKHNDVKINTKELCGLALNLYAKKIFNMVFTFTKIQEKDYINISRIYSKEKYDKDMLEKEKSMFTIYINNLISEYFGFKYEKEQPLVPITSYYAIDYESIKFLVQHNTYEIIKIKENSIEIDPDKIEGNNIDEQYIKEKKNEFAKLCTEIMIKAMSYYFDSAFEEIMLQKIVESTKNDKIISAYNNGDFQKKRDIVKKILIKYNFFKNEKYNYTYVIDN